MILSKIKMILLGLIMTFSLIKVDAQQTQQLSLTQSGKYVIGCNYWASHAGTNMWSDWRPDVLEADLKQMSEDGIQVI